MILGGCGEEAAPSPQQMIEQAGRLPQPLPGRYRSETRLTALDLPGAGEAEAALLRDRLRAVQPQLREFCLSAADAQQGFAPMVRQLRQGDCTIARFSAADGRMQAQLTCTAPGDLTARIRMTGTAGQRASQMRLSITQQGPAIPGGRLLLDMEVRNTRIGSC